MLFAKSPLPTRLATPVLVSLLVLATPRAQGESRPAPESRPAAAVNLKARGTLQDTPSRAEVAALIEALTPHVERLAGRSFREPVRFRISTVQDAARSLNRDFLVQFEKLYAQYPKQRREWLAGASASAISAGLLGKYGGVDRTLHLLPDRTTDILKLFHLEEELARGLFTLIVAHEMVHALQDQHIGLASRMRALSDQEDVATFVALIEGHAEFVGSRLAQELGLEAESHAFRKMVLLDSSREQTRNGSLELLRREARTLGQFGYVRGKAFFEQRAEKQIADFAWKCLEDLDADSARFYGVRSKRPDDDRLREALRGIEEHLGRGRFSISTTRVGAFQMHSDYTECTTAELRPFLEHLRGGFEVAAVRASASMRVRVGIVAFAEAEHARSFVDTAKTWWKREEAVFDEVRSFRPERFEVGDVPPALRIGEIGYEHGATMRVDLQEGPLRLDAQLLNLALGRHVISLYFQNQKLNTTRMRALLTELAKRVKGD